VGRQKRESTLSLTRRALAFSLASTGLWPHARAQDAAGVVFSLSLEPDSLDPTTAAAAAVGQVVHYNVLEGLTRIEEDGRVSPLLAESWQVSPDGRQYRFALRRDVRFHDGAPFDARAVRFSFERARAEGSTNKARKTLFGNITGIETPDDHTVVLALRNADAQTLFRLGENTAVILHPDSAAQAATRPVGTGPFRLERWDKGERIVLARSPSHRHAGQVRMPTVTFRFISDPKAQANALLRGEVDVFFNIATQQVGGFRADNRYQVLIGSSSG